MPYISGTVFNVGVNLKSLSFAGSSLSALKWRGFEAVFAWKLTIDRLLDALLCQ